MNAYRKNNLALLLPAAALALVVLVQNTAVADITADTQVVSIAHDRNLQTNLDNAAELSLNTRATSADIRSVDYELRENIADSVEARMEAANEFLAVLRWRARETNGSINPQFQNALDTVHQQEIQVRTTLRALRTASRERFYTARDLLALEYTGYLSAAARAEAAGQVLVAAAR